MRKNLLLSPDPFKKRRGVTLIELIFTMVIVGIVFTVIPKIMFALSKSDSFSIRQDAIFNGMSLTKMISDMPWDKNDTDSIAILRDTNKSTILFDCDTTSGYRVGGFRGGRNCEEDLNATAIHVGVVNGDDIFDIDNIGDFNFTQLESNTTLSTNARNYEINVSVDYVSDDSNVFNYNGQTCTISLQNIQKVSNGFTNLKEINATVYYKSGKRPIKQLTQFDYTSANIGLFTLNKRVWQ